MVKLIMAIFEIIIIIIIARQAPEPEPEPEVGGGGENTMQIRGWKDLDDVVDQDRPRLSVWHFVQFTV